MKAIILIGFLALILNSIECFSQYDFGVKINGGLSRISNSLKPENATISTKLSISAQGGLYLNYNLYDSLFIGLEMLFLQIEGKETMIVEEITGIGLEPRTGTDNLFLHLSYIGIPIYCGYKFKKITLNIGFQYMYMIYSSALEKGQIENNSWENKHSNLNFVKYNFGPSILITFNLSKKIKIEANYYYGLNNLLKINDNWKRKIQQLTFGLKYKIF